MSPHSAGTKEELNDSDTFVLPVQELPWGIEVVLRKLGVQHRGDDNEGTHTHLDPLCSSQEFGCEEEEGGKH